MPGLLQEAVSRRFSTPEFDLTAIVAAGQPFAIGRKGDATDVGIVASEREKPRRSGIAPKGNATPQPRRSRSISDFGFGFRTLVWAGVDSTVGARGRDWVAPMHLGRVSCPSRRIGLRRGGARGVPQPRFCSARRHCQSIPVRPRAKTRWSRITVPAPACAGTSAKPFRRAYGPRLNWFTVQEAAQFGGKVLRLRRTVCGVPSPNISDRSSPNRGPLQD